MKFQYAIKSLGALAVLTIFTACDEEEATYVPPVTATTRDVREVRTYGADPYSGAATSTTQRTTTTTTGGAYVAPVTPVETTTVRKKTTTVY